MLLQENTMTENKEPEDLGIKLGTPREVWWTDVKKRCEKAILDGKEAMIADKHMLKLAEKIIAQEQKKLKD